MPVPPVERQAPMPPLSPSADLKDPDRAREYLRLAALPSAVGSARRFTVHWVRQWGLAPLADDVELVASELVTNAVTEVGTLDEPDGYVVLHDATPPVIMLQLRLTIRRLFCEVWDPSPNLPVPVQATAFDEGGRGLQMIASLASRWTCRPCPAGGKNVTAWWELTQPSGDTGQQAMRWGGDDRR
jgi:anti-sigma regulatory factor (Ser/Thr protein kinase)